MKKLGLLFLILLHICMDGLEAQNYIKKSYQEMLTLSVDALEAAEDRKQIQLARRRFETISDRNPDKWLPVYYSAVSDVYLVLFDFMNRSNDDALSDVKSKIERVALMKGADLSEIYTLWAFYYIGLIVTNIPEYGPRYYQTVLEYSERAMKENPLNPRPVLLRAVFEQYTPNRSESKDDLCEELIRSEGLFSKEQKSSDKVYFGRSLVPVFMRDCD